MTHTAQHLIQISRLARRAAQPKAVVGQMSALCDAVNNRTLRVKGWELEPERWEDLKLTDEEVSQYGSGGYVTRTVANFRLAYAGEMKPDERDSLGMITKLASKCATKANGVWTLTTVDGKAYHAPDPNDVQTLDDSPLAYEPVSMPANWRESFADLYGLDAQIDMVHDALCAAIDSGFQNRYSVVLIGPPGCGKTDVMSRFLNLFSEHAVKQYDATALTAAGVIKDLGEIEICPRFIGLEEAEKAPEATTQPFLGIFDDRGRIDKVTARSKVAREMKCVGVATINDEKVWDKVHAGALSSRFVHKVYFKRPSREILHRILIREIDKINGDHAWASPCLDFCLDRSEGNPSYRDPRKVIALCITGAAKWLDGTFAAMLDATSPEPETDDYESDELDVDAASDADWGDGS